MRQFTILCVLCALCGSALSQTGSDSIRIGRASSGYITIYSNASRDTLFARDKNGVIHTLLPGGVETTDSLHVRALTSSTIGTSGAVNIGGGLTISGSLGGAVSLAGIITVGSDGKIRIATANNFGLKVNVLSQAERDATFANTERGDIVYVPERKTLEIVTSAGAESVHFFTREEWGDSTGSFAKQDTSGDHGGVSLGIARASGKRVFWRPSVTAETTFVDTISP